MSADTVAGLRNLFSCFRARTLLAPPQAGTSMQIASIPAALPEGGITRDRPALELWRERERFPLKSDLHAPPEARPPHL
ncbi:hypothetical protein B5V46_19105 (plasmid) [Rhodovulum sp. MB263]|nr:hypothetical protein B5V46_19105 [Rhodovulum sp. MB263]